MKPTALAATAMLLTVGITGCARTVPPAALQLTPTSLQERQIQTRRFATPDEESLQHAAAEVLQDLGFQIDESETALGVVVASKTRDARQTGPSPDRGAGTPGVARAPADRPAAANPRPALRPDRPGLQGPQCASPSSGWCGTATIDCRSIEGIDDPAIYQEFFDRLSQSVFLSAQGL